MEGSPSAFSAVIGAFWSPARSLPSAADARRFFLPLAAMTLVSLGFAIASAQRIDYEAATAAKLDGSEAGAKMTPHERVVALETARKVGVIATVAGGAFSPAFSMLMAALGFWLAFKVAGGKPTFGPTVSVVSHGMLPLALKQALALPALLSQAAVSPERLGHLLPSSLGALLPETEPLGPRLLLLHSIDLFALWTLVLVIVGMAHVAGVSKLRSAIAATVLWASYVAVFNVALPAMSLAK